MKIKELDKVYNPKIVEARWSDYWLHKNGKGVNDKGVRP